MTIAVAPGRPLGRPGALVLVLLALAGCEAFGGGDDIALDSTELTVAGTVHDVRLAGAGAGDSIAPAVVEAEPGDAVRFVIADRRPHAVAFVAGELGADARDYLERTGQLRGPPLVNEGAAWVVLLKDAPAGRYPFVCRSHDARGVLTVSSAD